jgi:dihydropteroate synthase
MPKSPRIMGIVNVTPDSFSGDGRTSTEKAIAHGLQLIKEGADILDIGGESTRPDATPLTTTEEVARVIPVITGLRAQTTLPLSIDTSKAAVAEAALQAGATIINDVWGGLLEPEILRIAAKHQYPIVLTHNSREGGFPAQPDATPPLLFLQALKEELQQLVDTALKQGISHNNIILDVGIGFGKTFQQNLLLASNHDYFVDLGIPLLLGTSRKSFIGQVLDTPVTERLEGSLATVMMAYLQGVEIFRVHDVLATKRVLQMTAAMQAVRI